MDNITFELWLGERLVTQVHADRLSQPEEIKRKALNTAYLLGQFCDLAPYIRSADIFTRRNCDGRKLAIR